MKRVPKLDLVRLCNLWVAQERERERLAKRHVYFHNGHLYVRIFLPMLF